MHAAAFLNVEKLSRNLNPLIATAMALLLSACGGGGSSSQDAGSQTALTGTPELEIARALYQDRRTPDGFYHEDLPDDAFYTTTHVRNTDLVPAAARAAMLPYDLSSDDFAEVVDWSETAASYQVSAGQLVAGRLSVAESVPAPASLSVTMGSAADSA